MKRLIALLLGIVLLLTAVPALAEEEMDELNKIARKVEEMSPDQVRTAYFWLPAHAHRTRDRISVSPASRSPS